MGISHWCGSWGFGIRPGGSNRNENGKHYPPSQRDSVIQRARFNTMSEIHIKLQRNKELNDWSLEINGRLHEHVSDGGLTDLVEGALIVASKSLI
jgi:hypothetical protein